MRKIEETEAIKMDLLARHTGRWGCPGACRYANKKQRTPLCVS